MRTNKPIILLFLLLISTLGKAQDTSQFFKKADTFFGQYVQDGKVAYQKIKKHPDSMTDLLEIAREVSVSTKNPKTYQAFWINAYNLLVIKSVVEAYPINSPLDVPGFFDAKTHFVGGRNLTLNDIENKLLRATFPNEPRFHFALVCAGKGCPPIINKAYLPETLDSQLQQQTAYSLNNPQFIRLQDGKVGLSQIFEWYEGDFKKNGKGFLDFINPFRKKKIPSDTPITFYPYDWSLNALP